MTLQEKKEEQREKLIQYLIQKKGGIVDWNPIIDELLEKIYSELEKAEQLKITRSRGRNH